MHYKEKQKLQSVKKQKLLFDTSGKYETKGPFVSFKTGKVFKKARWLTMHWVPNRIITKGFNTGLLSGSSGSYSNTEQMVIYFAYQRAFASL